MKAVSKIIGLQTFTASQFEFLQQTSLRQVQETSSTFGFIRQAAFRDFEDLTGRTVV